MDSCHKESIFTSEVCCLVVFWESHINVHCFASLCSYQLVFKSWDKLTWTKLKRVVVSLAAVKFNAVHRTNKVDDHCITSNSRIFLDDQFSQVVALTFYLGIHFFVSYFFWNRYGYFKVFVVAQFHFWFGHYFCIDHPVLTFFQGSYIDFWLSYHFKTSFFYGCFIGCWQQGIEYVLVKGFFTKFLVENGAWQMSFTETWQVDVLFHFVKDAVQFWFNRFLSDGKG